MIYRIIFALFIVSAPQFSAQTEKVIDTVFITDAHLSEARKTQQLYQISKNDIERNAQSLSEVLRFQTPVYIKENGRGMVSSPSFRGTTAQQTAFIWNGISVNSMFLGQGDINNLSLLNYDNIEVKSGGGSVIYGSAAIGGTIHLNNALSFDKGFQGRFFAEYGSFNTVNTSLRTSYSDSKFSAAFSVAVVKSDNDYEVPEKSYTNLNGQYSNQTFNISAGYHFSEKNKIFWHTQLYNGDQHYPIFEIQQTRTKYLTNAFRSLISWDNSGERYSNQLTAAFLEEEFSYFQNIDLQKSSGGKGQSAVFKDDFNYFLSKKIALNFIAQALREEGEGYQSGIEHPVRWSGSAAALVKYNGEKLYLEAGAKKEFVENIKAPFLYSFGGHVKVAKDFLMKFKASKNFRYPSFNDLYWQPGGNLDLKPETSYQTELTAEFFRKNFKISVTPYFNKINDMIRWLPTSGGYWAPTNTDRVRSYGLETVAEAHGNFGKHFLQANLGYAFTKSENLETDYQLSYVPLHKVFGMALYRFRPVEIFAQGIYNGLTFTNSNESKSDAINGYFVLNGGVSVDLFKHLKAGFKVNNITDCVYETSAYYPLPKRNYSVNLILNL